MKLIKYGEVNVINPALIGGLIGGVSLAIILILLLIYKLKKGTSDNGRVWDDMTKRESINFS